MTLDLRCWLRMGAIRKTRAVVAHALEGSFALVREPGRRAQLTLALLWLLDAVLQSQPSMFSSRFASFVLAPAIRGNPRVIAGPMRWAVVIVGTHPVLCNATFVAIQLAIGVGLMMVRTRRAALAVSIAWAIGIWWFGEGLGGVLTGASPITGAPGAALLYAYLAVLLWPRAPRDRRADSVSTRGLLGPIATRSTWVLLWGVLAYLLVLPANRTPGSLDGAVRSMVQGQAGWLVGVERGLGSALAGNGTAVSMLLASCCVFVAVSAWLPSIRRAGVALAVVLAAFIWITQAFGGIAFGGSTDPNTGPLLAFVAVVFWPTRSRIEDVGVVLGAEPARTTSHSVLAPSTPRTTPTSAFRRGVRVDHRTSAESLELAGER